MVIKKISNYLFNRNLVIGLFLLVPGFSGCAVHTIAPYDHEMNSRVTEVARDVDRLYFDMLDQEVNTRTYSAFSKQYNSIAADLRGLYRENRVKRLNAKSTRNIQLADSIWLGYKEQHKKRNVLDDRLIEFNQKYMDDLFSAILVGETSKPKL